MVFAAVLGSVLAGLTMQEAGTAIDGLLNAQVEAYAFARPNPGIHLSPSAGARYGMEQACLPHVMTGRPARDFFETATVARGPKGEGQYAVTNAITLKEEAQGACTIIARRGDPEGLRTEMLEIFSAAGAASEIRDDTGSNGDFRLELHCLTLHGKPLFLLMSLSSARNRPRLMASLGPDPDQTCRTREDPPSRE